MPVEGEGIELDGLSLVAERVARRRIGRVRIARLDGEPLQARMVLHPNGSVDGVDGPGGGGREADS